MYKSRLGSNKLLFIADSDSFLLALKVLPFTVHNSFCRNPFQFNPILHTAWLDNHALTLESNVAKFYFGGNPVFCILS